MPHVQLSMIDLPEFGLPSTQPVIPPEVYAQRLEQAARRASDAGLDALIVYGDREHFANLAYLTGYDPRFEESLLVMIPGRKPTLIVGLEGWGYAQLCAAPVDKALYRSFSLLGMPRDGNPPLGQLFQQVGIAQGQRVGMVGWKYFDTRETPTPEAWIEVPAFITDTVRQIVGDPVRVVNATALFMNPRDGLRIQNEVEQLAAFEFASTHTSQAMRNLLFGVRPGMTEFDAARLMDLPGLPQSVHLMLSTGARAAFGLPSPSSKVIERGEYLSSAVGLWGALNARGGFVVSDPGELPPSIRDYVDRLVIPYFQAAVAWYETIGIGVTGSALYSAVLDYLGDPFFGLGLNPGHYIHLDEWVHSPVSAGSDIRLQSGMAFQIDIIPATGTEYFSTNIEDGIALADETLRAAFARQYPEAWGRIQARRRFMIESLGIRLKPEVLPFSNIPAYLPPYLLNPKLALRVDG